MVSAGCLAVLAALAEWQTFVANLASASVATLAIAPLFVMVTYVFFALRWRLLLVEPRNPLLRVLAILLVGYGANAIFPMRAGDALRVVLVHKLLGGAMGRAVSSIVVERVTDLLTLLLMGVAVAFAVRLPDAIVGILRACAAIALLLIVSMVLVAVYRVEASRLAGELSRKLGIRAADAVAQHVRHFADAVHSLLPRDAETLRRLAGVFGFSVLGWGSFAAAIIVCLEAFRITPLFTSGVLLAVITNLGSAIPASPGSVGVYEVLGVLALSPWSVPFELALSVVTTSHAIAMAVQLGLALLAMLMLQRTAAVPWSARTGKLNG